MCVKRHPDRGSAPCWTQAIKMCACVCVCVCVCAGLDIQHCSRVSDQGLASLAQLTHLATLRMTGCLWVGNEGVRALTALHSVLLTLHLDKCVRISNDGLESLAKVRVCLCVCVCVCVCLCVSQPHEHRCLTNRPEQKHA